MTTIDTQVLDQQARDILVANDRGGYTIPTAGLYPYQWNWDSAFCAWGFSTFDLERAWREIEMLLSGQWSNGMVPHILFHQDDPGYFPGPDVWGCDGPIPSSGISQPPVAATFARKLWEKDPDMAAPRLADVVRGLTDWHRWFFRWRVLDGMAFLTHPWEAGRDNAPDWDSAMAAIEPVGVGDYVRRDTGHVDPAMRPTKADYDRYVWLVQRGRRLGWDDAEMARNPVFRVADPTMTFTLLRANRDLLVMARASGAPCDEIEGWIADLEAGAAGLWNPDIASFDSRDLVNGGFSGCLSNASYLCWYAGIDQPQMLDHFRKLRGNCRYPIPSHPLDSPRFEAKRYWRGPTWGIMNTAIGLGLEEMGHGGEAEALRAATCELIAAHGFAEYFDPTDGSAAGGGQFSWTAAIWLAWASPNARRA
ncbi:MAG: hypothetical protein AAF667_15460 [Pseudomonadota bacterium]